ncbi:MAG: hypothetical protein WD178_02520 [Actinomycetota bacterium]
MPNYEDFKKYGEMEKARKAEPAAPEPPEKPEGGVKKLLGKLKGVVGT